MAADPSSSEAHHPPHLKQGDSNISLNNRKRVVEKDSFVKTMMAIYTGNVEERKKIVFKL